MKGLRLLALCCLCLTLIACKEKPPEAETPDTPQAPRILRLAQREIGSVDPAFLNGHNDFMVAVNLYEGLYTYAPGGGHAIPALAVAHHHDDEARVWEFEIRPDARYADGTPVTARDFVFAWTRILQPATASPGADALFLLRNGRETAAGEADGPAVVALTDHRLRVELAEPQPYLLELLASPRFAPLPPSGLKEPAADLFAQGADVATGPFRVAEWKPRESLTLVPNPHYPHGPDGPAFDQVLVRFTGSEETALTWWDGRQVDLVAGLVPFNKLLHLRSAHGDQLVTQPMRSVFYLFLNLQRPELADREVRRALFSVLDREGLVTDVLGGGQLPATTFVPPLYAATGYDASPCPPLEPAAARKAVEPARDALAGTEMLCNASETLRTIMEYLQQNVRKGLDLFLALRMLEWGSFLATLQQGDFAIARMSLTGGPDPVDFFDNFSGQSSNNFGRFDNAEYDQLLQAIHASGDPEERADLMARAHALLCREMPAIPVYFSTLVYLVREPLLPAFRPTPEGYLLYKALR